MNTYDQTTAPHERDAGDRLQGWIERDDDDSAGWLIEATPVELAAELVRTRAEVGVMLESASAYLAEVDDGVELLAQMLHTADTSAADHLAASDAGRAIMAATASLRTARAHLATLGRD